MKMKLQSFITSNGYVCLILNKGSNLGALATIHLIVCDIWLPAYVAG